MSNAVVVLLSLVFIMERFWACLATTFSVPHIWWSQPSFSAKHHYM